MMRLATDVSLCASLACPLRLRADSTTQRCEGMPMMLLATLLWPLCIIGRPLAFSPPIWRRLVNDAVGDMCVAFAHHWHAFFEFGTVLVSFSYHFGTVFGIAIANMLVNGRKRKRTYT